MPKPISRKKLMRKLRSLGFRGPFPGGKHQYMEREEFRLIVPNPHGKDIGVKLVSQILRDIGISFEEFERR